MSTPPLASEAMEGPLADAYRAAEADARDAGEAPS